MPRNSVETNCASHRSNVNYLRSFIHRHGDQNVMTIETERSPNPHRNSARLPPNGTDQSVVMYVGHKWCWAIIERINSIIPLILYTFTSHRNSQKNKKLAHRIE